MVSVRTKGNVTIGHNEPCNEECCRDPGNVILCLKLCGSIQNLSPILGTQDLIHSQKRVPNRAKGHFVLVPEIIDCRNIAPHQLTSKYRGKEGNHKQEHYQVQNTVDIAEDFSL
jgi:hypothetical protein